MNSIDANLFLLYLSPFWLLRHDNNNIFAIFLFNFFFATLEVIFVSVSVFFYSESNQSVFALKLQVNFFLIGGCC